MPLSVASAGLLIVGAAGEVKMLLFPELFGPLKIVTNQDLNERVACGTSKEATQAELASENSSNDSTGGQWISASENGCPSRTMALWRPYTTAIFAALLLVMEWC